MADEAGTIKTRLGDETTEGKKERKDYHGDASVRGLTAGTLKREGRSDEDIKIEQLKGAHLAPGLKNELVVDLGPEEMEEKLPEEETGEEIKRTTDERAGMLTPPTMPTAAKEMGDGQMKKPPRIKPKEEELPEEELSDEGRMNMAAERAGGKMTPEEEAKAAEEAAAENAGMAMTPEEQAEREEEEAMETAGMVETPEEEAERLMLEATQKAGEDAQEEEDRKKEEAERGKPAPPSTAIPQAQTTPPPLTPDEQAELGHGDITSPSAGGPAVPVAGTEGAGGPEDTIPRTVIEGETDDVGADLATQQRQTTKSVGPQIAKLQKEIGYLTREKKNKIKELKTKKIAGLATKLVVTAIGILTAFYYIARIVLVLLFYKGIDEKEIKKIDTDITKKQKEIKNLQTNSATLRTRFNTVPKLQ